MAEQLIDGLIREVLHDGRIVIFTLSNMRREVVDMWIDASIAVMRACQENGWDIRVMQDLSNPDVAVTPYSQKRSEAVAAMYPDLAGKTAIVMPPTFAKHQLEIFIRKERVAAGFRERKGFLSREEALAWLEEDL